MSTNEKPQNNARVSQEKTELAQKIAANSQRISKTYANIENAIVYFFRLVSSGLTKIFLNNKFSKIFALLLAIGIYLAINYSSDNAAGISQSAVINGVPVQVIYNSEIYEIEGIPENVDVLMSGDVSDITIQRSKTNSKVTCDLTGLTEGNYNIKLRPTNFIDELTVYVLETPSVNVKITKKVTLKHNISYEFINTNQIDPAYTLETPTFDTTEVLIRAGQETLDSISFVKALIDVKDVTGSFSSQAKVLAYDNNGNVVNCDIIPETVNASVNVITNSKEVPIIIRPIGTLPNNLALDSVSLDHSSVTLYADNNVLSLIDAMYIDLDVSQITKDTALSTTISTPSGVRKMSVTKINMDLRVGKKVSKTINDVKVAWENFDQSYKLKIVNEEDALLDVVISGTQSNLDKVTANDISVYINLAGLEVGNHQAPIEIKYKNHLVEYKITNDKKYVDVIISKD